jgi:WD40 repeat protein/serine/threonine protein kinase
MSGDRPPDARQPSRAELAVPGWPAGNGSGGPVEGPLAGAEELSFVELLEAVLADQGQRWHQGERIPAREYLRRYPALEANLDYAATVVYREFVLRVEMGEAPDFQDYLADYISYASSLRCLHEADQIVDQMLAQLSSPSAPAAAVPPRPEQRPRIVDGVPEIWKPGDVILGLYEVREVFTSGGRGLVYRVRHRGWNVDLAVKCPRPECFCSEKDKDIFEGEAETWVKLSLHPHTAHCYYVRRLGGIPRVFAEFVEGGSLAEWIRTKKLYTGGPEQSLARILDVAIQFAWGLQHAHEQGLVHRDVKPGNVLLTVDGTAKVTDFGMAKARGTATETMGGKDARSFLVSAGGLTLAFCSPEQIRGQRVSRKTDIWSWGVSVLEMFSGAVTWSAGYLASEALQVLLEQGTEDEGLPPMPPALAQLLQRCFRPQAKARPKDMLEIVAVLQEVYQQVTGSRYARQTPRSTEALADSLNNRAVSLLDLNKEQEAEQLWQEALVTAPNHPEASYNLGLSRWRAGRLTDAALVHKLQEVCASHPREWLPLYLLAEVYLDQGNWVAAIATLEKITGPAAALEEVRTALAAAQDRLSSRKRFVRAFHAHTGCVSSVALSADGRHVLSSGADHTVKLWQTATGNCLRTFEGHDDWVTSVCLSPDGRCALSGSADQTLKLWEVATGKCLRTLRGHEKWARAVTLSADGRYALSGGGDGLLKLWEVASETCLRTFTGHLGPVTSVALSADGCVALSGSIDQMGKLWEVATGHCVRTLEGHTGRVLSVCLSLDGRYALSGSADKTLKLWEVATGRCLRTLEGHTAEVHAVCLSADGGHALSGSGDRTVKVWRLTGGRCLATLEGHKGAVNAVFLSTGGQYAVSGSTDQTLRLWQVPRDLPAPFLVSREPAIETAHLARTNYKQAMARAWQTLSRGDAAGAARLLRQARAQPGYSRQPEAIAQWSSLYIRLLRKALNVGWEGDTFEGHTAPVTSVCLSRNGRHALSGSADGTLKLWNVPTGHCLRNFPEQTHGVTSVCVSENGSYVLSGGTDGTLALWELATGRCLRTFQGHTDVVTSASLSSNGRQALSGSADRTLRLWDLATGRCLRTFAGHQDQVHSVSLSPDGRSALSGSAQFLLRKESEKLLSTGQLKLWETATGRCLASLGPTSAVAAVCLSTDGRYALSGGGQLMIQNQTGTLSQSSQFHLWELATGECLRTFEGHRDLVTTLCLSYDGRYVLSGSSDRTVKLWQLASGQCVRTFVGHTDTVTSVSLSADGRYALSGSSDGTLKLWILDWELEDNQPAYWDEGARPYLETFLTLHTPYGASAGPDRKRTMREILNLPLERWFKSAPTDQEFAQAWTPMGKPIWSEEDFEDMLYTLGCAGYGWLRAEGVRRKLEQMARKWNGPPPIVLPDSGLDLEQMGRKGKGSPPLPQP